SSSSAAQTRVSVPHGLAGVAQTLLSVLLDFRLMVPEAMRSASMLSVLSSAAARKRSYATAGSSRRRARSARNAFSSSASGSSPYQSRCAVSSNVAFMASSATGNPAMTSSPAVPSTMLSDVSAAMMPSNPL